MRRLLALAAATTAALLLACATPTRERPVLRVGTSGDYAPFSYADPDAPDGFGGYDVELIRSFAADAGFTVEWVRFRWPELLTDLAEGRFDLAVGGVTVRPERSVVGRFSVATAQGGAVLLHQAPERFRRVEDLDLPGVRVAVNSGGHLERVARARFPNARLVLSENRTVPRALAEGRADAVLTDVFEAPHWLRELSTARTLGPFTRDRKAWLLRADRPEHARRIDTWLLAREADGTLAAARARHFERLAGDEPSPATAEPLTALVAAMDERLALMPAVAEAKRARGIEVEGPGLRLRDLGNDRIAVRDPERERLVLAAAMTAVQREAEQAKRPAPHPTSVRALFRAQIVAARQIQVAVLAGPAAPGSSPGAPPDLEQALRPALLRVGERIAALLVRLPASLGPRAAMGAVEDGLDPPHLAPVTRRRIAQALAGLVVPRPGPGLDPELGNSAEPAPAP